MAFSVRRQRELPSWSKRLNVSDCRVNRVSFHATIIPTPSSESKLMNLKARYGQQYKIAREEGADRR
jgi:hypothetical protein